MANEGLKLTMSLITISGQVRMPCMILYLKALVYPLTPISGSSVPTDSMHACPGTCYFVLATIFSTSVVN